MTTSVLTRVPARTLNDNTLTTLGTEVLRPRFDRTALTPAVVHIGVGGFHRAHQLLYLDDLAALGYTGWGEVGVGLRSPAMRDALAPQDHLYTVLERDRTGDVARVVGSMIGYRYAPDDPGAVLDVLADPRTRLVTLTITGDGYPVGDAGFEAGDPAVRADLRRPHAPQSAFGYLVEALDRRRRAGLPGFTVLSCDNVPDNGAVTRTAVIGFALARDERLAQWIDRNVTFPASMVDRITPATDGSARHLLADRFGVHDRWPVVAEPFRQWIVENKFCNGRPPLDLAGVQFVDDLGPYKLMKTRLLNAGHSALGYLAGLTGDYDTTGDALTNPVFADYLTVLMRDEIAGLLPPVPDVDVEAYQRTLLERFANPRIGDRLSRLGGRGSTKMPAYLLPSLVEARSQGRPARLLTLAVAAWCRYLRGYDLKGNPVELRDGRAERLQALARAGGSDPRPLLAQRAVFGALGDDPQFVARLEWAMQDLEMYGPVATICDNLATGRLIRYAR